MRLIQLKHEYDSMNNAIRDLLHYLIDTDVMNASYQENGRQCLTNDNGLY